MRLTMRSISGQNRTTRPSQGVPGRSTATRPTIRRRSKRRWCISWRRATLTPNDRLRRSQNGCKELPVTFGVGASSLLIAAAMVLGMLLHSIYSIGPTQIGLVRKRFGAKLPGDNPLAFRGEAGYQAQLLMPGLRFKFGMVFAVTKHPWVQVPAGQIGVVIAQVGQPLPIGAKSAVYKPEVGNFSDLNTFIEKGGQKGVQRPVLSPGTLAPIHPVAFMVSTKPEVFRS